MKKQAIKKHPWARLWLYICWTVVVLLALLVVAQAVGLWSAAMAATGTGQNAVASLTDLTFVEYICRLQVPIANLVYGLVLVTIIVAGVVYAGSMGSTGSGELSIGLAKQMIVAALTGLLFFYLGQGLIGKCNEKGTGLTGGLIVDMIQKGMQGPEEQK